MSEEEKEAIKTLKNIVLQEYDWWINKGDYAESNVKEANDAIKTVLNLIEKQQKEIECLKIIHETYKEWQEENDFISKDKIRRKIKEYEELVNEFEEYWSKDPRQFKKNESIDYYKLEALKELLEEE